MVTAPTNSPPTERTAVKRMADRGSYDRRTIDAILDATCVCHLGFVVDEQPYVIPTICARADDTVYIHGSPASRMVRTIRGGVDVCLTATLVDGIVAARSSVHHSLNYRSVVVLGRARLVTDHAEKWAALETITNHVLPGRFDEARTPNDTELRGVSVLGLPLAEASAKVRTGHAKDEPEDYNLPIWAGVVPINICYGHPVVDPQLREGIPVPSSVQALRAEPVG